MDLRRSRFNHALFLPSSSSSLPSSALSVPSSHRLRVDQYANNAVHCRKAINRTDVTSIEEGGEARWEGRTATAVSGSQRFMSGSVKLSPCHFNATAAAVPCPSAFHPSAQPIKQAHLRTLVRKPMWRGISIECDALMRGMPSRGEGERRPLP